jgi:hypothetical protein
MSNWPSTIPALYISNSEYFGADLTSYFNSLETNGLAYGYWFIRYYNSDPSEASFNTIFESDSITTPVSINGRPFTKFGGTLLSGSLPTDAKIYSLTYYPYTPV